MARRPAWLLLPALVAAGLGFDAAPAMAQTPVRISTAPGGVPANGASGPGVATPSGSHVAFVSAASNLVAGDTNGSLDVFLRNLQTGVTTRVSVAPDGSERVGDSGAATPADAARGVLPSAVNIDVDDNVRFVAFVSSAPLVDGDTNTCVPLGASAPAPCPDIYLRDMVTNFTLRVNLGPGGVQANGPSWQPRLAPNALSVTFVSAASNLVPDDTNGVPDVFLWSLVSGQVTRISTGFAGEQSDGIGQRPSGLRGRLAWISTATNLDDQPDPVVCHGDGPCLRAFTPDIYRQRTRRVPMPAIDTGTPSNPARVDVIAVDSASTPELGEVIAVQARRVPLLGGPATTIVWVYQYQAERIVYARTGGPDDGLVLRGRHLSIGPTDASGSPWVTVDLLGGIETSYTHPLSPLLPRAELGMDGTHLLFTSREPLAAGDTNGLDDVYFVDLDPDGDGIPLDWEQTFGLDPGAADGLLDPDGDGTANRDEFRLGSHPRGTVTRYLAEGSANGFFSTRIALVNPGGATATVLLRYQGSFYQLTRSELVTIPAGRRATVELNGVAAAPDFSFSTTVESDQPVVVDRTMTWNATAYGSHAERALDAPSTSWFLAEGATHGGFALFYLLQNPAPYYTGQFDVVPANVTITYLRPAPAPPIVRTYQVFGSQRLTIPVDTVAPELDATDVSARIESDRPILVERAMYRDVPGTPVISAGHDGAAVASAAPRWFLAEGATGDFFDLYYLIANPSGQDTRVRVTYLLPQGAPIVKEYDVRQQSRVTISVDYEDPALAGTPVSAVVESLDGTGVVVERSMWWPGQGNWQEGHLAGGVTATSTRWAVADGETGGPRGTQTYVLIANTSANAGSATLTLYFEDAPPDQTVVPLPANSRVTVPVSALASTQNRRFGVVVDSGGVPVVVERAMYSNANGIVWAAGTAIVATPLP